MLPLVYCSNRTRVIRARAIYTFVSTASCSLACLTLVFLAAQPSNARAEETFEKSKTEIDTEVHEKKSRTGVKIAPPQGGVNAREGSQAVDELFRSLPEDAREGGEVSVPAEDFGLGQNPEEAERKRMEQRRREFNVRGTDEELSGGRKSMDERHTKDLSDLERKLGVETEDDADGKVPSYTMAVQRIKERFKAREYEEALIGVNELLRHYPKAPQLLLMKGTLHQRAGQIDLALTAFQRAFEYEPSKRLKAQIDYIKRLQAERERLRPRKEGIVTPLGVEDASFAIPPSKGTAPRQTAPAGTPGAGTPGAGMPGAGTPASTPPKEQK